MTFMNDNNSKDVFGFVSASGQKIVNGTGKEFLFRGVGLGSWFLPEGYMWCFPDKGDRPRRMARMISDLIGSDEAEEFWRIYYDSFIGEEDIRRISDEGFNSLRLPLSSRYLLGSDKAIKRVDRLIEWCKKYHIYVILDLHGAPGGQTGTNIDDSEKDQPELFIDESNARQTVKLWKELALRYRDEWIVAGYDLLNEPLPQWFSRYNDKVIPLYKEIIAAIREVDDKHMIILEGVHWATDWSIFTERLDDNMMLQFHKYWNSPDRESLETYLAKREELDVPIFMGEGGENNSDWNSGAFQLFEDLDISWNFWTWKKMERDNSPCSITRPGRWDILVDYLEGGDRPEKEEARAVLLEFLQSLPLDKCQYRPEVTRSLLRRPPLRIPAVFYSCKEEGVGYMVGNRRKRPAIGFREGEPVPIGFTSGKRGKVNFQHSDGQPWSEDDWLHVQLDEGDWLSYDFLIDGDNSGSELEISLKGRSVGEQSDVRVTILPGKYVAEYSFYSDWSEARCPVRFNLEGGRKTLRLTVLKKSVQIERIIIRSP